MRIKVDDYVLRHSSPEPSLLRALNRNTMVKILNPRMLSGALQGRFLSMIAKMLNAKNILEIGTYTGYSALCFAEAIPPHGRVDTIEVNDELETFIRSYFEKSEYGKNIFLHIGKAIDIIPTLDFEYDLVFIDADKSNYPVYYDMIMNKLPIGGVILADNVLWGGKVLDIEPDTDADTRGILEFNKKVATDVRVECVMLPLRDGITIIRKIRNSENL